MSVSGFRRTGHWPTLVAALVHFDVSFMVWVLLGALGAYIARDLGLSSAEKGLMVAVPPLGGAAFRLVLGTLADRVGLKRTGLASLGVTLVPLAWGAVAGGTYVQVLGIGLLLGVAGASFAVALPIVGRWYPPEQQGLALGIAGAGNSGTIVATLLAPRLAEHVGWHAVFAMAMVPVAAAWVVFATLAREPARPAAPARHALALLAEPDARWLAAFYLVTFGGFVGLAGYLPIYFVDRFALPPVVAASYASVAAAAGSLLRPVGGALADRLGGTRVLQLAFGAIAVCAAALTFQPGPAPTVALLTLLLGTFGIGNGAVFQLVPKRFPHHIGAVTGLVGAVGGVGGFLLAFGFGTLTELTGSYAVAFAGLAGVGVAARAAVTGRQRVWRRAWQVEVAI